MNTSDEVSDVRAQFLSRMLGITRARGLLSRVLPWSGILCLNYHRIGDGRGSEYDRGLWSATPEAFQEQIRFLKSHCEVIGPADLPGALSRGKGRFALLTFDDGYEDNYRAAFPILKSHGVQALFFISTGFVDRRHLSWWDEIAWMVRRSPRQAIEVPPWITSPVYLDNPEREAAIRTFLRAYKAMPADANENYMHALGTAAGTGRCASAEGQSHWMTWDMVREMRRAGMEIGGHTVDHPILPKLPRDQQLHQIVECGRRIAAELGEPMRYFSYPVGNPRAFNEDTRACLREAGVQYAFSYYGGYRRFSDWDDLDIRRIAVETDVDRDTFRALVKLPQVFARPKGL